MAKLIISSNLEKALSQLKEVNETFKAEAARISEKTNVRYITGPDSFSDHIEECIDLIMVLIVDDLKEQL